MGPELVPLQYCPFRGTIQAKPHTNTTLSSLPWDIKSNRETPAWASAVHVTQPEEASGRGWDYVEASESHLGHKSQGCTQCRVMQSNPRAVTTQLCHLVDHHPSLAFKLHNRQFSGRLSSTGSQRIAKGLLSLHNPMSQFLIKNIIPVDCTSLESSYLVLAVA